MHNESQISSSGEWGDVAIVENNKGQFNYYCKYCINKNKFRSRILNRVLKHIEKCKIDLSKLIEGIDFVVCKICNMHGQKLSQHIAIQHPDISKDEYKLKYDSYLITTKSSNNYSIAQLSRESWQSKAIKNGIDLSNFYKICGEGISKSIMNNPDERARHSQQMKSLYDEKKLGTSEMKIIFSETAKKTSTRQEIIQARSKQLQQWRAENPEEFKTKCTDKMLAAKPLKPTWFSKPEKLLFTIVYDLQNFNFKFNQIVKSNLFNWKSKRKQIDIADKQCGIYIEFDGPFHFKAYNQLDKLLEIQRRDKLLEEHIIQQKLLLIRISYDQFQDKKKNGGYFNKECLNQLFELIEMRKKEQLYGVFKIGEEYGKYSKY